MADLNYYKIGNVINLTCYKCKKTIKHGFLRKKNTGIKIETFYKNIQWCGTCGLDLIDEEKRRLEKMEQNILKFKNIKKSRYDVIVNMKKK